MGLEKDEAIVRVLLCDVALPEFVCALLRLGRRQKVDAILIDGGLEGARRQGAVAVILNAHKSLREADVTADAAAALLPASLVALRREFVLGSLQLGDDAAGNHLAGQSSLLVERVLAMGSVVQKRLSSLEQGKRHGIGHIAAGLDEGRNGVLVDEALVCRDALLVDLDCDPVGNEGAHSEDERRCHAGRHERARCDEGRRLSALLECGRHGGRSKADDEKEKDEADGEEL